MNLTENEIEVMAIRYQDDYLDSGKGNKSISDHFVEGFKKCQDISGWIVAPNDNSKIPSGFLIAYGLNNSGKERTIRAYYVQPFTELCDLLYNDNNYDYSEEKDEYYLKEGWYECNDCEEVNWKVTYPITHFQPLPSPPQTK